jgi:hypothetical protein
MTARLATTLALFAASTASTAADAPQAILRDARIQIAISGDTARVRARYRVQGAGDSLRLNAIRIAGQSTALDRALGNPQVRLDTLPGLFRLTATGRNPGFTLDLRYRVLGDLSRIPLFVPEAPAAPGESRLLILVNGLAPGRTARFPFPRFNRPGLGPWVSTPAHLPAFVALVAPSGGLPVPALAQWSVLLIALGGTGVWLVAQLRARRLP